MLEIKRAGGFIKGCNNHYLCLVTNCDWVTLV